MPVVHCKKEPFDVYIGRPSKWGNPFTHLPHANAVFVGSVEEAIERYTKALWYEIQIGNISLADLAELDGKTLGCWCHPKPCHGTILLKAAAWAKKQLEGTCLTPQN